MKILIYFVRKGIAREDVVIEEKGTVRDTTKLCTSHQSDDKAFRLCDVTPISSIAVPNK
jgi:hypothetical protein